MFDIAYKDLLQLVRERNTFLFLLIMPVAFTLLFGYAFGGGSGSASDSRLPVGYLDQDNSRISAKLHELLSASKVIRLDEAANRSVSDLAQLVAQEKLAGVIVVPAGYGRASLAGRRERLTLVADTASAAGTTAQAEVLAIANRLDSALNAALAMEQVTLARVPFDHAFQQALSAWDKPPISVAETISATLPRQDNRTMSASQSSPGMMLQFAIAGLLTAAQVIVSERKSRTFQRLLTTAALRIQIVLGHYLAIFFMILTQLLMLIAFGQFALNVAYLRLPGATFLVAFSAALCIAALGLLIGILARTEEQAAAITIVLMFVLSGLGGAWVPLELAGATFQAIGHVTPLAWAMDGIENICARGLGFDSVLYPAAALAGYAVLFFALAVWRLNASEER